MTRSIEMRRLCNHDKHILPHSVHILPHSVHICCTCRLWLLKCIYQTVAIVFCIQHAKLNPS